MSEIHVKKSTPFSADIKVPGDKSISHRSIILASLSNGPCEISGFLPSADCWCTVEAFRELGVPIEVLEEGPYGPTRLLVTGKRGRFDAPGNPINCGNSGTTMRLLSGVLTSQPFEVVLTGDESLSRRPMDRVATPLRQMGAMMRGEGKTLTAPIHIIGTREVKPIEYDMPVASAQVKSAILLAGLAAKGKTTIIEPAPSRDHTERLLQYFLVKTIRDKNRLSIWGGQTPESRDLKVPGDISSAAFWIVAAAAMPGARLFVRDVGLNPTRTGILSVLLRMGARIQEVVDFSDGEPIGSVEIHGTKLKGVEIGGAEIPNVIDEIPILAVAGALAEGKTTIRDAKELRVKESDRISAVAESLRRMGCSVEEYIDGMEVQGGVSLSGATIDSLGDHRIAMAFAIAGLFATGTTTIRDVECIGTSYPGFAQELKQVQR